MIHRLRSRRGYTLPELLLVVAIIAITCAIGIGGILSQIKSLRQMKLDRTAQTIYTAAQNRLTELYSSGDTARFDDIIKRDKQPSDWDTKNKYEENKTLTVIRSGSSSDDNTNYDKDGSVIDGAEDREDLKRFILPEGSVSEDLYNNNWVIELNPANGCVYSVFYSERSSEPTEKFYDEPAQSADGFDTDKIRSAKRSDRLKETDARVGYFSAQSNAAGKTEGKTVEPMISIDNSNKLDVTLYMKTTPLNSKLDLVVTITGESSGNSYVFKSASPITGGGRVTRHLTLDRLIEDGKEDLSFYTNFCLGNTPSATVSSDLKYDSNTGALIPGENLKITFEVKNAGGAAVVINEDSAKAETNSLFGYGSKGNTTVDSDGNVTEAKIECARHLQNLDTATSHVKRVDKATQTGDIDFSDTKNGGYANVYGSRAFTPIDNTELNYYDGGDFKIKSLTTGSYRPDGSTPTGSGLFECFYGSELKNIKLIGLKANNSGVRNAGALAAELSAAGTTHDLAKTVVINNCSVYLEKADYDDYKEQDDIYSFIKAEDNAGGLIGLSNVGVSVTDSFAGTTVEAGVYESTAAGNEGDPAESYYGKGAGGIIGWARGNVNISNSYADCYLTGAYIGGLAGFIYDGADRGSSISGSYSAGFALISDKTVSSAGFAGNRSSAGVEMKGAYTVLDTGTRTAGVNTRLYSTITALASGTAEPEAVYYLTTGAERENITGTEGMSSSALSSEDSDAAAAKMNKALSDPTAVFGIDMARDKTSAYSLKKGLGLDNEVYPYPHLKKDGEIVHHYCDWLVSELTSGKLVYFEKYSDGKWGWDGNGTTLYSESQLGDDLYIVTDGYAVLYTKADYETLTRSSGYVKYSYNGAAEVSLEASSAAAVGKSEIASQIELWNEDSVLLLLPDDVVNAGLSTGTTYSGFYQRLAVNNSGVVSYYNFAPHFARSVIKTESEDELVTPNVGDRIYVRSPRQLYLMSELYSSYQSMTAVCEFYQEADLNYTRYTWAGDSHAYYTSLSAMSTGDRVQRPIADGSSNYERFTATYNGHYHIITGFSISTRGDSYCAGLFGAVDGGILKNVVISAEYQTDKYTLKTENNPQKNGQRGYYGLLCGYLGRDSEINNCAAASYQIAAYSYGSSEIYVGGLVGYNLGYISNSSATIPSIQVHSNESSSAHAGGFVGYNSGSGEITSCYSLSYINAATFSSSGEYLLGGFAGSNSGSIEKSYCAMAYTSSGIDTDNIIAFTQGIGQVSTCLYLDGGSYFYVNDVHSYNYTDEMADTYAKPASGTQLKGVVKDDSSVDTSYHGYLGNAFGVADASVHYALTKAKSGESGPYPYPAVVTRGSGENAEKIHYGEWFFDSSFSDFGFVYWEKEEGGTNNGYHYYIIDANGAEHSTLCEAHDDGGTVKQYGYGYYYKSDASETPEVTWDKVNASADTTVSSVSGYEVAARGVYDPSGTSSSSTGTGSSEASAAAAALGKAFNKAYVFVVYRTTETGITKSAARSDDGGMFITDSSAYASCKITGNLSDSDGNVTKTDKTYIFTPFFGKSMELTGTYTPDDTSGSVTVDDKLDSVSILGHNTGEKTDKNGANIDVSYVEGLSGTDDGSYTGGIPFEIRSISQLQNLNWRWDKKNATSEVTEDDTKSSASITTVISETTATETIERTTNYGENGYSTGWWSHNYDHNSTGATTEITVAETSSETVLSTRTDGIYTIVKKETRVLKEHKETLKCTNDRRNHGSNCSATATGTAEVVTRITETRTRSKMYNNYTYLRWYANGDSTYGGSVSDSDGHNYYWRQTHDVNAHSKSFTPIGGLVDTTKTVDWSDPVSKPYIAYFNGDYNGCSYKIQNVNINTTSQTVGLIGTAVCANLRNIILYSSEDNTIQTDAAGYNWYCLGGLVGLAAQGNIYNCAVAGYTIQDNRVYSGAGDADVGGLAGFCATNISNCSSVNNIVIKREYGDASGYEKSGNVFVGGMAGICPGSITNSYCGGNISSTSTNSKVLIYIGGFIGGEWFRASGLQGLTKYLDLERKLSTSGCKLPNPTISNCYSYVKLPVEGTNRIESVAPLASYGNLNGGSGALGVPITVKNCYYYASYAGSASNIDSASIYNWSHGRYYTNFNYQDAYGNTISNANLSNVMGLSYDTMKSISPSGEAVSGSLVTKLNTNNIGAFGLVTIKENGGAAIKGKYSFPGSDRELQGENYPFPTIVTQSNPFYDTEMADTTSEAPLVNVHYGEWPKSNGLFTNKSSGSIDLLTSADGASVIELKYYENGTQKSMDSKPTISFGNSTDGTSEIVNCELKEKTENGIKYYELTVTALKEGYETIELTYTRDGRDYTNTVDISVTAEFTIEYTPVKSTESDIYVGKSTQYYLRAYKSDGTELTGLTAANWTAELDEQSQGLINCSIRNVGGAAVLTVTGLAEGTAYISLGTQNITSPKGRPIDNQYRTVTVEVNPDPTNSFSTMSVMLYSDGDRLDSASDRSVAVAYSESANDDADARANLSYWTDVVSSASVSQGRSFSGWVTEDGEAFTASTKLGSAVRVMASWKSANVSFMDKAPGSSEYSELGTLSYYGGSFYTDNTLSTEATIPLPYQRSGAEVFSGYWTDPDGGELIVSSEGVLAESLPETGSIRLYARFDVSAEELAAIAKAKSNARSAAAAAISGEMEDKTAEIEDKLNAAEAADTENVSGDIGDTDASGSSVIYDDSVSSLAEGASDGKSDSEAALEDTESAQGSSIVIIDSSGHSVSLSETSAVIGYTAPDSENSEAADETAEAASEAESTD